MASQSQETHPTDGVTGVLSLFERFPLVALCEAHGLEQEATFIADLVQHPTFPELVQAIVVESGNALHQGVVDRFIAGDSMAPVAVRPAWRDFAGAGPWGFTAPIYQQFFYMVRAVNQGLSPERRIRVLLGDPPVDWQAIRTPDEFVAAHLIRDSPFLNRNEHFVRVVEQEILGRGQRALLVSRTFHLLRRLENIHAKTVTMLLDRHYPSATYVVLTHDLFYTGSPVDHVLDDNEADLEARLAAWLMPGFAPVQGTWLGDLPASTLFGRAKRISGGVEFNPWAGISLPLSDLADGYLYLGPTDTYTYSHDDSALLEDEEYMAEVRRRQDLMEGSMDEIKRRLDLRATERDRIPDLPTDRRRTL